MTSDLDIHRAANELIEQHGLKGASDYSADRIKMLMDVQDDDGVAVWRRIMGAGHSLIQPGCDASEHGTSFCPPFFGKPKNVPPFRFATSRMRIGNRFVAYPEIKPIP